MGKVSGSEMGTSTETWKDSDSYSKPKSLNHNQSEGCTSPKPTGRNDHLVFPAYAIGLYKKPCG